MTTTRRTEPQPRHKRSPGDRCLGCNRKMRPTNTKVADYPGTINYHSHGRCGSCYRASIPRSPQVFDTGTPCTNCERPMRPRGTFLKNHPGTVVHHSNQVCYNCINGAVHHPPTRGNKTLEFPARPENLDRADNSNYTATERYIQERRHRGIPVQGIDLLTWRKRNAVAA